jgi:hypothetical protein
LLKQHVFNASTNHPEPTMTNTPALLTLAQRLATLNPAAGEIGAGMLAQLVDAAQAALQPVIQLAEGERYIGAIVGADGKTTHIILLPGDIEATWQQAVEWAASIGGALPDRVEQALLFATARDAFQPRAYWSCQEDEPESGWAWFQGFYDGGQRSSHKLNELRARAVRRLPI